MKKVLTKKSFVFCFTATPKAKTQKHEKKNNSLCIKTIVLFFGAVLKKHTQYDIINTKTGRKTNG